MCARFVSPGWLRICFFLLATCTTQPSKSYPWLSRVPPDVSNCSTCLCWMREQLMGFVPSPTTLSDLYSKFPKVSIVIVFYNEEPANLLGTLYSIWNKTDANLLKEIILVDDCSDSLNATDILEQRDGVRLIRNPERYGLIKARMVGARAATAKVLVFLDSHVTCTEHWLEPLLVRLVSFRSRGDSSVADDFRNSTDKEFQNENLIVSPIIYDSSEIDDIDRPLYLGGFTWNLTFRWEYRSDEPGAQSSLFEPQATPAISGGIYATWRSSFFHLGGYDEEMKIWGAENIELSLRTWMCHGRLEIVPCSRVGHLFRTKHPYTFPDGMEYTVLKNRKRAALVWLTHSLNQTEMMKYLFAFYTASPSAYAIDAGSVVERKKLANQLKCHSFSWYISNVYPQLVEELEMLFN